MTKEEVKNAVKSKGYVWFDSAKDYDVNIVGIRNTEVGNKVTNLFDDYLTISYKIGGKDYFHCWEATTDAGKKWVLSFSNSKGVARLKTGQYRGVYAISQHGGRYEALCQRLGNVTVWRDNDKNLEFSETKQDTGMFGINIHKAGTVSQFIDSWSAGCQVFKRVKDFNEFMVICKKAKEIWGNKFTYTLIESNDL